MSSTNTARTLFVSSIARTLFLVVNIIVSFFMMPFIIGHLGAHWYGIWVIIGNLTGYYYLLDLGFSSAVPRYTTEHIQNKNYDAANGIINTALVIYTSLASIIILVTFAIIMFAEFLIKSPEDLWLVRVVIALIGLSMALEFPFKAFTGIIQANLRFDLMTYSHFITFTMSTVAVVYFLSRGHGILALAVIGLVSAQVSNLLYFCIGRHLFKQMKIEARLFRKSEARKLLSFSVWAFVINIAQMMRFQIDSIVIGGIISATAVTHYFIGARLVDYFQSLIFRATDMTMPIFIKDHVLGDMVSVRRKLLFATRINAALGIFGSGLIIIVGKAFILRWMGSDYLDAYPVLVVLIIAAIAEIVVNPLGNVLYAINRHSFLAKINLAEGVVKLSLSLLFIHYYGIIAVAIGTAAPLLIVRIFLIPAYVCKHIGLSVRTYLGNLTGTVAFTGAYLAVLYWIAQPMLMFPSYSSIICLTGAASFIYGLSILFVTFSKGERRLLLSAVRGNRAIKGSY